MCRKREASEVNDEVWAYMDEALLEQPHGLDALPAADK